MRYFLNRLSLGISIIMIVVTLVYCDDSIAYSKRLDKVSPTQRTVKYYEVKSNTNTVELAMSQNTMKDKNVMINSEKLKQIILNMVNDNLWYVGKNLSSFKYFELQTYDMGVYVKDSDNISVVFHNKNKKASDSSAFYLVKLYSDTRGILNEYSFCVAYSDQKELLNALKNDGYVYDQTIEMYFSKAEKPHYPELSQAKKVILNKVKETLIERMKIQLLSPGTYQVYLTNFRDNSRVLHAAIENASGRKWLLDFTVYDDGEIQDDRFYLADSDNILQWVEKCKIIAALKAKVKI